MQRENHRENWLSGFAPPLTYPDRPLRRLEQEAIRFRRKEFSVAVAIINMAQPMRLLSNSKHNRSPH